MRTCLVLGATGFVGKTLCHAICENYNVVGLDRKRSDTMDELKNFTFIEADYCSITDFSPYLKGIDVVIHLISTTLPQEGTAHIPREIQENVVPTVRLLEDMVRCGVKEIVFASSGGTVYGENVGAKNAVGQSLTPMCAYGMQKSVIESYLAFYGRMHGLTYKIMRIANIYGVGQDAARVQGVIPIFINALLAKKAITIIGDGKNVRDYIFIDDLVDAFQHVLAYDAGSDIFNIGTGKGHDLLDVITLIEKVMGEQFKDVIQVPTRDCDVRVSVLDVKESVEKLNWKCNVTLEQGIQAIVAHYTA